MSAQMLFWSKGHPNGAYIAREIIETFGAGSGGVPADLRGSGAGAPPAGTVLREIVAGDRCPGGEVLARLNGAGHLSMC